MTQSKPQRIGFIGLGMMGDPMSRCLAKGGYTLFLHDADLARAESLRKELNAQPLTEDSAATLDALITMLPNSAIVESVLLGTGAGNGGAGGSNAGSGGTGNGGDSGTRGGSAGGGADAAAAAGWARRLKPGAIVIDMSSSEPARSRDLGATLHGMGLSYLDAPVSGGVKRARDGSLAILVGGEAAILQRCMPLLGAMGKSILHIGGAGAGHAAKALNNYVSAAGLMATVEALHVAARFGIDPAVMTDVLNASTGRSNTSENKVKQFMLNGSYASGFAMQLMNKDLKIAHALAEKVGYPLRVGDTVAAVWDQISGDATPATDHTEMYRMLDPEARAR
jgi:3-hydroxyisobutyrate dehydrogenase